MQLPDGLAEARFPDAPGAGLGDHCVNFLPTFNAPSDQKFFPSGNFLLVLASPKAVRESPDICAPWAGQEAGNSRKKRWGCSEELIPSAAGQA